MQTLKEGNFQVKNTVLLVQIFNQEIQEFSVHFINNIHTPLLGCLDLSTLAVTV
jgi:hypothetical protein